MEQNTGDDAASIGPGREVLVTWEPQHTFVVNKEDHECLTPSRRRSSSCWTARRVPPPLRPHARRERWPCRAPARCWRPAVARRGRTRAATRPRRSPSTTRRRRSGELNFSNWPLYIDEETIKDFDKKYGGKTKYVEDINDNDEFTGKVQETLRRDRSIDRDIVVLTDWMAARWIRSGWCGADRQEEHPEREEPGARRSASPKFDPQRQYTLPWQSGMTAIGYNPEKTGRKLDSINDLFDPKFKGRVTMLQDWRDSAALVMLGAGQGPRRPPTLDDVMAAIDKIARRTTRSRSASSPATTTPRASPAATCGWSPTRATSCSSRPTTRSSSSSSPRRARCSGTDNMMMPQKPPHPYAAETMMNYVYDPVIAAQIAAYVNYVTPVKGAKEELAKTDPETAENPLIFPSDET